MDVGVTELQNEAVGPPEIERGYARELIRYD
jgi:hypothetical protein